MYDYQRLFKNHLTYTYGWFIIQQFFWTSKATSDSRSLLLNPSVHRSSNSFVHHGIFTAASQYLSIRSNLCFTLCFMKCKRHTRGFSGSPVLRTHLLKTAATIYLSYYLNLIFGIWNYLYLIQTFHFPLPSEKCPNQLCRDLVRCQSRQYLYLYPVSP